MSRYWTHNSQRYVDSKGHGPAYGGDGGKVLKDTETQPPYNANIGPDGPDLNRVGFPTVKAFVKARFMQYGRPHGMEGPSMENGDFYSGRPGMLEKAGEALSAVGGSMDTNRDEGMKVYEPSRNSGSEKVPTQFSPRVKRYKE